MNSRERILNTLHRRPVDRLPVDCGGTRQSGIAAVAYHRLRERLGVNTGRPVRVYDLFQMLAEIEQQVAERFGADCVALQRPQVAFGIRNEAWKPCTLFDGTRVEVPGGFNPETEADGSWVLTRRGEVIARMPHGGFYFDRYEKYPGAAHPDLSTWRPPTVDDATMEYYHREAEALYTGTDKAIVAAFGPPYELFNGIGQGGLEEWMMTFASEPEYVQELYGLLVDAWLDNLRRFHGAVGDRVQVVQICDDFGTQASQFLSEGMFRELVLPAYKRGLDWIHAHTSWKVLLHSDGAIFGLLPAIVEMGVDILNPVQTTAVGMDPQRLKDAFGDKLIFWGGACDCQNTLTFGTPEQVAAEVRAHVGVLARGGGQVFASVHNIQANVPADNIVAMFDTAREFDAMVRATSADAARR
ncbi:MAG: methyltransferase [Opitutae bacterium]|nr:methyltransferase [Opitutae bacterium]